MILYHFAVSTAALVAAPASFPASSPAAAQAWNPKQPSSLVAAEWSCRSSIAALRLRPDRRGDLASELRELGTIQLVRRKYSASLASYLEADKWERDGDTPDRIERARVAENLAELHLMRGLNAEAEEYLVRAWRVYRHNRVDDAGARADMLSRLARLYHGAGKYDWAMWCAHRAVQFRQALRQHPVIVSFDLQTLARTCNRLDFLDTAKAAIELAETLNPIGDGMKLEKARYLIAAKQPGPAVALLRDLSEGEDGRGVPDLVFRAHMQVARAEILAQTGDPERSQLLLLTAMRTYCRIHGVRCHYYIDTVARFDSLFPTDTALIVHHIHAVRAAARDEELRGPRAVFGELP